MSKLARTVATTADDGSHAFWGKDQQPFAGLGIAVRCPIKAQRVAPLVPGDPGERRFIAGVSEPYMLFVSGVDEDNAKLRNPHTERGIQFALLVSFGQAMSSGAEQIDHRLTERPIDGTSLGRTDHLEKRTMAGREILPGQVDDRLRSLELAFEERAAAWRSTLRLRGHPAARYGN